MIELDDHIAALRDTPKGTPAYVVDEVALSECLAITDGIRDATGCKVLFPTKSFSFQPTIDYMMPRLDGLSASSPFEAWMGTRSCGDGKTLHFTSPGVRSQDFVQVASDCDFWSFNTVRQYLAAKDILPLPAELSPGLRVNTGLSFVGDDRYDPCRVNSRLGEHIDYVDELLGLHPQLEGLLIHTNCESTNFHELNANIAVLENRLHDRMANGLIKWVNLGGGYVFHDLDDNPVDLEPLALGINHLKSLGLEVFIEPGAAVVRSCGNIVATVLEIQGHGDVAIAILDTTVNHMPEVFEYQFEPYVYGQDPDGAYTYMLAGSTCLAGDVLGTYRFHQPLQEGDRVVVGYIGAYNLVKAHTFNGVNLPYIYHLREDGDGRLLKTFDYNDYSNRWSCNVMWPDGYGRSEVPTERETT